MQRKDIVVFDFDGTLSASDTNLEFFKYCFKHSIRPWVFIPVILVAYIGRIVNPKSMWWRRNIRRFITPRMVERFAPDFIREHKTRRFPGAAKLVAAEKKAGNKVVLISASPDYLIPGLVDDMGFDAVMCSKMKLEKPWQYKFFCWGKNKVVAMDKWAMKHRYFPNIVRAYSDSKSDKPIMDIAKEQIWIDRKTGKRKK